MSKQASEEERLKELSKCELFLDSIFIKDKTARQILVSAYNKLKRQQKEIKKEKSRIMELAELLDKQENEIKSLQQELEIQKGCSISKDKIRDYFAHDLAFKRRLIREKEEISDYNRGKFDTIEDLLERLEDNKWN